MNANRLKSLFPQLLILIGMFAILYHDILTDLIKDWSENDNYSHGFLIPIISGYMIWQKKQILAKVDKKNNAWGLLVISFAISLYIVGNIGAELFFMRFSIVVLIAGLVLYMLGKDILLITLVPILYLIFMIPIPAIIWNKIAFPLQLFAAKLSASAVYTIGIPVLREGNVLHLANTSLEVVDACSGLRSLTSLLALAGAFAYIGNLKVINKWILFLSAVPVAILVNVFRLTITAILAHRIGEKAAQGFLHDASGLLVFVMAFIIIFLISIGLSKFEEATTLKKRKSA